MTPPACLECGLAIAAVTSEVDPQAIGLRYRAACDHEIEPEVAADLWRAGYRWTQPVVDGASLGAAERARQVHEEGYTAEHDAQQVDGLAWSAWAYVDAALNGTSDTLEPPVMWPRSAEEWKATATPLRRLVIAEALIMAEIDRRLLAERSKA